MTTVDLVRTVREKLSTWGEEDVTPIQAMVTFGILAIGAMVAGGIMVLLGAHNDSHPLMVSGVALVLMSVPTLLLGALAAAVCGRG